MLPKTNHLRKEQSTFPSILRITFQQVIIWLGALGGGDEWDETSLSEGQRRHEIALPTLGYDPCGPTFAADEDIIITHNDHIHIKKKGTSPMALDNLISVSFTDEELTKISAAIEQINTILKGKAINLTPEDRRQYGSIADRNKLLVDKAKFYMEKAPTTVPKTIDKAEFDRDYAARGQVETPLRELTMVAEKLRDTKTLLDYDNLQTAMAYYRYVKYLASQNEPGTTTIYQDLKLHYPGGGKKASDKNKKPEDKKPGDKKPEDKKPDDKKKPDNGGPDIHLPEE